MCALNFEKCWLRALSLSLSKPGRSRVEFPPSYSAYLLGYWSTQCKLSKSRTPDVMNLMTRTHMDIKFASLQAFPLYFFFSLSIKYKVQFALH